MHKATIMSKHTRFALAFAVLIAANVPAVAESEWRSANFPAPNAGELVFRILPDGNPACASYNGQRCLWGERIEQIDFARVHPLVCGAAHRARYGVTGFEDPNHWCNLALKMPLLHVPPHVPNFRPVRPVQPVRPPPVPFDHNC
jgi:hypothetical protein